MSPPISVEETVKQTFARQFVAKDWKLFKSMAEFYFQCAVFLKKRDVGYIPPGLKLLVRNSLKRLYIGIGTELLLKAIYLKHGFLINCPDKRDQPGAPTFPFTAEEARAVTLSSDKTYMLDQLINKLRSVPRFDGLTSDVLRGLKVAKVFRNKEGHGILPKQQYDPLHYRYIEASLAALYVKAFGETLQVRFSLKAAEKGVWKKCPLSSSL